MLSFNLDNVQYEANSLGAWLGTRNRGVFSAGSNMLVSAAAGLNVNVAPGLAWLKQDDGNGVLGMLETAQTITLAAANASLPRLDVICVRLTKSNNQVDVVAKTGTPAATPSIVSPVHDNNYDEIYLAKVLVAASAVSIDSSNITDLRLNKTYCGLVRDGVTTIPFESIQQQIQSLVTEIRDELSHQSGLVMDFGTIYPVGSVYMSMNNVSPAALFGGTWTQIQNRFLIAASASYASGSTGGAFDHTHTTSGHALTISEMPAHTHNIQYSNWQSKDGYSSPIEYTNILGTNSTKVCGSTGGSAAHNHGNTGSASNLPPYIAVYMWYRTA